MGTTNYELPTCDYEEIIPDFEGTVAYFYCTTPATHCVEVDDSYGQGPLVHMHVCGDHFDSAANDPFTTILHEVDHAQETEEI